MTTKPDSQPSANDLGGNARRFESTLGRILSVPKDELTKREVAYQKTRRAKKSHQPKPVHP